MIKVHSVFTYVFYLISLLIFAANIGRDTNTNILSCHFTGQTHQTLCVILCINTNHPGYIAQHTNWNWTYTSQTSNAKHVCILKLEIKDLTLKTCIIACKYMYIYMYHYTVIVVSIWTQFKIHFFLKIPNKMAEAILIHLLHGQYRFMSLPRYKFVRIDTTSFWS